MVTKAYSSAVGAGPFVSEIFGDEAEELRRGEQGHRPVVHDVPSQEEGHGRGAKQRQQGGFHQVIQLRTLCAPDEVQHASDQEKGAGDAPHYVFSHVYSV